MIPEKGDRTAPGNRDRIVEPGWSAAGANPLFMAARHAGFATLAQPVGIGVATLVPGGRDPGPPSSREAIPGQVVVKAGGPLKG